MNQPTLIDMPTAVTAGMISTALLSPDGTYRYRLTRIWDATKPRTVFIMLNPSTADATLNDPTIVRCINFAKRQGCGSIDVVNLFALRSTNPKALRGHPDPVGPENDFHLRSVLTTIPRHVVAAWGAHTFAKARAHHVQTMLAAPLSAMNRGLTCLGKSKDGHPRHPLYLPANAPLTLLRRTK